MEEHPAIEREHTRVHEENKTEADKVRWVWPVEDGENPDITPPSKVQHPDAPTVKGEVLVGECRRTQQLTA